MDQANILQLILGQSGVLVVLLVILFTGSRGTWRWKREVETEGARADRAEKNEAQYLTMLLDANRLAAAATNVAVESKRGT